MNLNRRNFLFGSAATLKPGEKANVALIGFGIQQRSALMPQFVDQYKLGVQVVAVCDCDKERREAGAKMVDEAYAKRKITDVPKCRVVTEETIKKERLGIKIRGKLMKFVAPLM